MRILMQKAFHRFQRRERIADSALADAIERAESGLVDADLGGGLIKQRVARPGKGKSGGYRTVIAYRAGKRAVFLYGFAKSDRDNIDDDELDSLRKEGAAWLAARDPVLDEAIANGRLREVADDGATQG